MGTKTKIIIGLAALLIFTCVLMPETKVPEVELNPTYVSSIDLAKPQPKVDTAAALKLKPKFAIKKDEYSGDTWITHKNAPRFVNANGIYCYWNGSGERPGPMRFRVQYFADDWLFIESMTFLIDGQTYRYTPLNMKHDNEDGDIWEWTDEIADDQAINIIQALASATKAKVKFQGSKYYDEKTITAAQLKAFKESVQLYQAMGGDLN